MLLIVAHHYVVNSGLLDVMALSPTSGKSLFLYLWGMWGKTGINCFVMITGYFLCRSDISLRKLLKLLIQVEFYKVIIYLIFIASGYEVFSMKGCIKAIIPVYKVESNFVGCFLLFYLFIPFLNLLIRQMDRKMHLRLLLLCLGIYTLMGTLPGFRVRMNYVTWFSVLYLLAAYIRMYGVCSALSHRQWGMLTLGSIVLSMASVVCLVFLSSLTGRDINPFRFVSDSNVALAVLTALCSFMYFKDLRMPQSRIINTIAASTFGVLLIHANSDTMRTWLWRDTLANVAQYPTAHLYTHAVLSVLAVFIVCILIDHIRIRTFESWAMRLVDRVLERRNSSC